MLPPPGTGRVAASSGARLIGDSSGIHVTQTARQPARGVYAAAMIGGTAAAIGLGLLVSMADGGDSAVGARIALALGVALIPSLIPIAVWTREPQHTFGLLVFGASNARLLLVVALGWILASNPEVADRPLWFGLASGAVLLLAVETGAAAFVINRMHRAGTPSASSGDHAGAEHA